jgi:Holliday junction resolvase RusA-like endonuclease
MSKFIIPGNCPSSKNSKIWTGRFLVWSKTSQKYRKAVKSIFERDREAFVSLFNSLEKPVKVGFKYIRGSKHKFDYVNPLQTSLDIMVEFGWLEDDNADIILPVFEQYEYDKLNPRTEIIIYDN